MFVPVALTVLCALAVVALLAATRGGATRAEWVLKPVAATSFVAAAVAWGALDGRFGTGLLIGLVLSWCGDVLLIGRGRAPFLAGLIAFLLGHVAYAVSFGMRGVAWGATGVAAVATLLVLLPVS